MIIISSKAEVLNPFGFTYNLAYHRTNNIQKIQQIILLVLFKRVRKREGVPKFWQNRLKNVFFLYYSEFQQGIWLLGEGVLARGIHPPLGHVLFYWHEMQTLRATNFKFNFFYESFWRPNMNFDLIIDLVAVRLISILCA